MNNKIIEPSQLINEVIIKDLSIETLRGIAIILMVAGHVVGNNEEHGLKVNPDSFLRYFYYFFQYIRMPLFTVISGYIYSLRPIKSADSVNKFIRGKFIRLLIPFFVVSTIQYFIQYLVYEPSFSEVTLDVWRIYLFSYDHFWFLQAMFLVFIIIILLELANLLNEFKRWLVVLLVTLLLYLTFDLEYPTVFSIDSVLFLLPFFILGCGLCKFSNIIFDPNNRNIVFIILIFIVSFSYQQWIFASSYEMIPRKLLIILVGLFGTTCLVYFRFVSAPLTSIGYFSFVIYLYHSIFAAATRVLLYKLQVNHDYIHYPIGLVTGLFFPILIYKVLSKYPIIKLLFFGEKNKTTPKILTISKMV